VPQIPVYQAQTQLPVGGPLAIQRGGPVYAPDAAPALQALGHSLGQYAAAKRALDLEDMKLDVEAQSDLVKTAYGNALADLDQAQLDPSTASGPGQYSQRARQAMDTIVAQAAGNLKYPQSQRVFYNKIEPWAGNQYVEARQKETKWRIRGILGAAELSNSADAMDAATTDDEKIREAKIESIRARDASLLARGLLEKSELPKYLSQIEEGIVRREAADPTKLPVVTGKLKRGEYKNLTSGHAQVLIRELTSQSRADQEYWDKKADRDTNKRREDAFAAFSDGVLGTAGAPKPTEAELTQNPNWTLLTGPQREHLVEALRKPAVHASDEATKSDVYTRAFRDRPTITEAEIVRLRKTIGPNGLPLLNDENANAAIAHVTSRKDHYAALNLAEAHRGEDKALADLHRRHEETVHKGILLLSTTGAIAEKLDRKATDLQGTYLRIMSERSKGYGRPIRGFPRNEEPENVDADILPGLAVQLAADAMAEAGKAQRVVESTFKYKTVDELNKAYAGKKLDETYQYYMKTFREIESAKENYARIEAQRLKLIKEAEEKAKKH